MTLGYMATPYHRLTRPPAYHAANHERVEAVEEVRDRELRLLLLEEQQRRYEAEQRRLTGEVERHGGRVVTNEEALAGIGGRYVVNYQEPVSAGAITEARKELAAAEKRLKRAEADLAAMAGDTWDVAAECSAAGTRWFAGVGRGPLTLANATYWPGEPITPDVIAGLSHQKREQMLRMRRIEKLVT